MATPVNWIKEKGRGESAPAKKDEDVVALYPVWDSKVLIHRRKADPKDPDSHKISTPGGGFEAKDVELGVTAEREAREEAGLNINKDTLKILIEPNSTGRRFVYFYTELPSKPTLDPNPTHIGEVDQTPDFFKNNGIPGEDAGNFHWWAEIDPLITWLNDPKNAAFKADYVVKALIELKGKIAATGAGAAAPITFRGMTNKGNSCYFAAVIQMLKIIPDFPNNIKKWTSYTQRPGTTLLDNTTKPTLDTYNKAANALKNIYTELTKPGDSAVDVGDNYTNLLLLNEAFKDDGSSQKDAHEFFHEIIEKLYDSDSALYPAFNQIAISNDSESSLINPPNTKTNKSDPAFMMDLSISSTVPNPTIKTLITDYEKPEPFFLGSPPECTFRKETTFVLYFNKDATIPSPIPAAGPRGPPINVSKDTVWNPTTHAPLNEIPAGVLSRRIVPAGTANAITVAANTPFNANAHGPFDSDLCAPNTNRSIKYTMKSNNFLIVNIKRGTFDKVKGTVSFNESPVTIDKELTLDGKTFYATGAVIYSGSGGSGHYWFVTFKPDSIDIELEVNDGIVSIGPKRTESPNTNATLILYSLNKIKTEKGGAGAGAGAGSATGTGTSPSTKGLRRNINSEARLQFDDATETAIVSTLNILGEQYNLQKHPDMKAAPASLTQFMTNYGINIDYGIPIEELIKAFYAVFPDAASGLPITDYGNNPAFHVICNYLQYRILTLSMEIQLKRRSSPYRADLEKRSQTLQAMLENGKCGTMDQTSALKAFQSGTAATGGPGCCDELNKKLDAILKLMSGPDQATIDAIEAELAGPTPPSNDRLKEMLQQLGQFGRGTGDVFNKITALFDSTKAVMAATATAAAPTTTGAATAMPPDLAAAQAKAKADMDALLKVVQPDLGKIIGKITDDIRTNGNVTPANFRLLLAYFDTLLKNIATNRTLMANFQEVYDLLLSLRNQVREIPPPPGAPAGTLHQRIRVNEQDIQQAARVIQFISQNLIQSEQSLRALLGYLKQLLPFVGDATDAEIRALLGEQLDKLAPFIKVTK